MTRDDKIALACGIAAVFLFLMWVSPGVTGATILAICAVVIFLIIPAMAIGFLVLFGKALFGPKGQ